MYDRYSRRFGLPTATALVMGNIIGGGILPLPALVAPYGTVSLVAFVVLSAGALALALVFGKLAQRDPRTGGPYVYARAAFGDFAGFLAAWSYLITTWVSNAALAVAAVGYLDVLVPVHGATWRTVLAALVILWLPALANLAGTPVRRRGATRLDGAQVRAAAAGRDRRPGLLRPGQPRPVPGRLPGPDRQRLGRATVLGTLGAALAYLLGTLAVFGTVAHADLVDSTAPFSDSVNAMFGGDWGGVVIACAALVSMTGALNGWTLMSAQAPYAAARDGLFPAAFLRRRRGVPTTGVLVGTALASLLTVAAYMLGTGGAFETLVLVTTFTATVPYLLATAAQLYFLLSGQRDRVRPARLTRDAALALTAFGFSLWLVAGAGYAAVYQGVLFLFAGVLDVRVAGGPAGPGGLAGRHGARERGAPRRATGPGAGRSGTGWGGRGRRRVVTRARAGRRCAAR